MLGLILWATTFKTSKFRKADLNITNNLLLRCDILTNFDSKTIKIRISTKQTKHCLTSSKYCLSRQKLFLHKSNSYSNITVKFDVIITEKCFCCITNNIHKMSKCLHTKVLHHLWGICLHYIAPPPTPNDL